MSVGVLRSRAFQPRSEIVRLSIRLWLGCCSRRHLALFAAQLRQRHHVLSQYRQPYFRRRAAPRESSAGTLPPPPSCRTRHRRAASLHRCAVPWYVSAATPVAAVRPLPASARAWRQASFPLPNASPPTAATRFPGACPGAPGCRAPAGPRSARPGNTEVAPDADPRRTSRPCESASTPLCLPAIAAAARPRLGLWRASAGARPPVRSRPAPVPARSAAVGGAAQSPP